MNPSVVSVAKWDFNTFFVQSTIYRLTGVPVNLSQSGAISGRRARLGDMKSDSLELYRQALTRHGETGKAIEARVWRVRGPVYSA
jgi:hypothetical protein